MTAVVEHGNRERRQIALAALLQRGVNNDGSLCERENGHSSSNLSLIVLLMMAAGPINRDGRDFSIARAVLFGFLVTAERPLDQRQLDAARSGFNEHRLHVFDGAVDIKCDGSGRAALEH